MCANPGVPSATPINPCQPSFCCECVAESAAGGQAFDDGLLFRPEPRRVQQTCSKEWETAPALLLFLGIVFFRPGPQTSSWFVVHPLHDIYNFLRFYISTGPLFRSMTIISYPLTLSLLSFIFPPSCFTFSFFPISFYTPLVFPHTYTVTYRTYAVPLVSFSYTAFGTEKRIDGVYLHVHDSQR